MKFSSCSLPAKRTDNPKFVVYVIRGTTIKRLVVIDLLLGTGIYYAIKLIVASSVIVATIGSVVGSESVKRIVKSRNRRT